MPVTLKKSQIKYKDPSTGNYVGVDAVAEKTTAEMVSEITTTAQTKMNALNTRATEIEASYPDVQEMEDMVAEPFVQSKAYPAGKQVIQAVDGVNKLFILPDGHNAGDAWGDTSKLGPYNLGDQVSDLKSAFHKQHDFTPYVGPEMFTLGRSLNSSGQPNYNARGCCTLNAFDVSNVEHIRWIGQDNASKQYYANVYFFSDIGAETLIKSAALFGGNHQAFIVSVPANAKTARMNFLYYSASGVSEITSELFEPYYGVYFEPKYDKLLNGADFQLFFPHSSEQSGTFSSVLAMANGKSILMDFGSSASASNAITKIKRLTARINIAIISHYHDDHVGGLDSFLSSDSGIDFTDCVFYLPPYVDFSELGETAPEKDYATKVAGIKSKIEAAGATYQVIDENTSKVSAYGFDIHFYNIDSEKYAVYYETLNGSGNAIYNNFSMVNTISYRGKTFLYTSDIVEKAQELNTGVFSENIDVLYAPHHGWNDCHADFVNPLSPKYCITQNYRAQIPEYIDNLNSRYIPYMNTADCKTISVFMGDIGIYMYTEESVNTNGSNIRYIQSGDDLNTLKDPGMYICSSDEIAATLTNCPVSIGFTLDVEYGNAYTRRRQTLRDVSSETCRIYTRTRGSTANSWTNWFLFEGTIVN